MSILYHDKRTCTVLTHKGLTINFLVLGVDWLYKHCIYDI